MGPFFRAFFHAFFRVVRGAAQTSIALATREGSPRPILTAAQAAIAAQPTAVGRRSRRIMPGQAWLYFIENRRAWRAHSGRVTVIGRPPART